MDVKLAASIPVSLSAMRQRTELPANAIIAEEVRAVTLAIRTWVCRRFWGLFGNNGSLILIIFCWTSRSLFDLVRKNELSGDALLVQVVRHALFCAGRKNNL